MIGPLVAPEKPKLRYTSQIRTREVELLILSQILPSTSVSNTETSKENFHVDIKVCLTFVRTGMRHWGAKKIDFGVRVYMDLLC